jgi:hypothetical protein
MPESMRPSSSKDNVANVLRTTRTGAPQISSTIRLVGHTHTLPCQDREDLAIWIPQHPVKRCVRKTIEDTILSDKKST